ncbi:hypothetical protein PG999_004113 [Apiospora kogelbergensis]|uniref:Polyketide synthase n=1 Tax=Apiospora kogelbergensis TaxID=1337665 RepID=A0AAW0R5L4_9PEZI
MDYSFAVFGPQGTAPSTAYLLSIREYITNHPVLRCVIDQISTLNDVLELIAGKNQGIAALEQAPEFIGYFTQWLIDGKPEPIVSTASSITVLPRLILIHVTQYFQFLESQGITHTDFLARTRATGGGMQGYCGGMPSAVALASAADDKALSENIMAVLRLSVAIGLYTELGDDTRIPGLAIMVVRVEKHEQAQALVDQFPGTYISAFTDPRNISVVGPSAQLEALKASALEQGFFVQPLEIRGKVHNPENMDLARELSALCRDSDLFNLPNGDQLHCPVRSNRDGDLIPSERSLSDDVLYTILASQSQWYQVLVGVAEDLKKTGVETHNIISLGMGDFIPLLPFNKQGLRMKKIEFSGFDSSQGVSSRTDLAPPGVAYPEDAIAIVGASCRLPGANNLEELWELIASGRDTHQELQGERFDIYSGYRSLQSAKFAQGRKWYGNFIDGVDRFDREFFGTNPRETANMDPQQRLLLELAYEAMECYGYTKSHVRERGDNVGCFIGASFTEYLENAYGHAPTAYTAPGTIRAFLCGRISYYFGWTGPSEVIDTACSASLVSVNRAIKAIRGGECPVALAGGVNIISGIHNYLDLGRAGFLSATGQCKPWDIDADGYCRSDGVGLVVLKSLRQAQADGDNIMGVIAGAATNQGGLSSSITNPDPVRQAELYRSVLRQAGLKPDQVTNRGASQGDSYAEAWGHTPQASHKVWNPKIPALGPDRMALATKLTPWASDFRAALVNSFGAAGSNATVVCCEAPKRPVRGADATSSDEPAMRQPIILSAHSASSLDVARHSLAQYLTKTLGTDQEPRLDQISYTLSEKRRRLKHSLVLEANTTKELIEKLQAQTGSCSVAESPDAGVSAKPVVLVFGGQSKQVLGLDKDLYYGFAGFREAIDMCDEFLTQNGYPPIVPAIFQTEGKLDDIVTLQTGHVAIQYAAATMWIRAGLEVSAILGHSLGELTALAVSGRLSIHNCLKLVAERATLMQQRWGEDKGSMVSVFTSQDTIDGMMAQVKSAGKIEIACYNSETSQVVSGNSAAIEYLIRVLEESKIKYVRVDTSHAFHSHLVEPILQDLDQVSASLAWKEASIPMELCGAAPSGNAVLPPYSPSRHAREPVYFAAAVQRLEQRLGAGCVWLEAGANTPIMNMTKRATLRPQSHSFLASSTKDAPGRAANLICRTVSSLWSNGVPVTHWPFLGGGSWAGITPVWLPPYSFDRTTAWLDNIDRATELQRQLNEKPAEAREGAGGGTTGTRQLANKMVMPCPETAEDRATGTRRFRVGVEGKRFQTIVAGHAVRNRPLCPASVYLECAAMAVQHVVGEAELAKFGLEFQDFDIQAPLGLAADQQVEVAVHETTPKSHGYGHVLEFAFVVCSYPEGASAAITHAKGRMVMSAGAAVSKLDVMARLAERSMETIKGSRDAETERMMSGRVYQLFSRVVDYGKVLQGISQMTLRGTEAFADVALSASGTHRPGADESSVLHVCDAVALDGFIQVVGLSMNTNEGVPRSDVMICNGIDSSIISQGFDFKQHDSYRIYTSFKMNGPNQALGDVFAWSADGQVVAAFINCRFVKLNITRLERLLNSTNGTPSKELPSTSPAYGPAVPSLQPKAPVVTISSRSSSTNSSNGGSQDSEQDGLTAATTPAATPGAMTPPLGMNEKEVLQLLETYTGASIAMLAHDAIVSELGLDSLASTELASELLPVDGCQITSEELLAMNVGQLVERLCGPAASGMPRKGVPEPAVSIEPDKKKSDRQEAIKPAAHLAPQTVTPEVKNATKSADASGPAGNKVTELLVETTGINPSRITRQATLNQIGVDSLALTDILSTLAEACLGEFKGGEITIESKVADLLQAIGVRPEDEGLF